MAQDSNGIVDHGQSKWPDLWKKEDYLAICFMPAVMKYLIFLL